MELLALLFPAALVVTVAVALAVGVQRERRMAWRTQFNAYKLALATGKGWMRATGKMSGHDVEVYLEGANTQATITIDGCDPELQLRYATLMSDADLASGDPGLDRSVDAEGPRLRILAALTPDLRRLLRDMHGRWSLRDGRFTWSHAAAPDAMPHTLMGIVNKLAKALPGPMEDPAAALAARFPLETQTGVAIAALDALKSSGRSDLADAAVDEALSPKWSGAVRLHAAKLRNDVASFQAIANDAQETESARTMALAGWVERIPGRRRAAWLRERLEDRSSAATESIVEACQEEAGPDTLNALKDGLRQGWLHRTAPYDRLRDPKATRLALRAIDTRVSAEDTGMLCTILQSLGPSNVPEALDELSQVGTIDAVEPLLDMAARVSSDDKARIQRVVRAIQARLGNAASGRLTLTSDAERGGLSLSEDDARGRLAQAEPRRTPEG